jgi:hypothetical protein
MGNGPASWRDPARPTRAPSAGRALAPARTNRGHGCDDLPERRSLTEQMGRTGLAWLLVAAVVSGTAVFAEPASASRPFSHAVLHHQSADPGLHNWLIVKTVTGPYKPRRMTVRASGVSAPAKEIERAHGRWIVSRRTSHGRALIRALRAELRESGVAKLHAIGRYQCHATFRVFFRIRGYNEPAPSHFEDATGASSRW